MNPELLQVILRQEPFWPFEIVMNDGRIFVVDHPELLYVGDGFVSLTNVKEGYVTHLNLLLISSIAEWTEPQSSGGPEASSSG